MSRILPLPFKSRLNLSRAAKTTRTAKTMQATIAKPTSKKRRIAVNISGESTSYHLFLSLFPHFLCCDMTCLGIHTIEAKFCKLCGMITAPDYSARDWDSLPSAASKNGAEVLGLMKDGLDFDTSQMAVDKIMKMTELRGK